MLECAKWLFDDLAAKLAHMQGLEAAWLQKHGGYGRADRPRCFCRALTKTVVSDKGGRSFQCRLARFEPATFERILEQPSGRPTGCNFRRPLNWDTNHPGQPAFKPGFEPPPEKPKAPPPATTVKNGVAGACTCASLCAQGHHCPCKQAGRPCGRP